jgi:pyruvate dehydrogenase E2 component (dihydrolipoamide acetyltransferase)
VLQTLVADPSLISADMVEEVLKFKRLDGSEAALRRIADANFAGGAQSVLFRDALAAAELPIAVIVGEEDHIIPPTHAEGLPTRVFVTRVAGAGHLLHLEKSAEVNEAIRANIVRGD